MLLPPGGLHWHRPGRADLCLSYMEVLGALALCVHGVTCTPLWRLLILLCIIPDRSCVSREVGTLMMICSPKEILDT